MKPTKTVILLSVIGTIILAGIFTLFLPEPVLKFKGSDDVPVCTGDLPFQLNTDITFENIIMGLIYALIFGAVAVVLGVFEIWFLRKFDIDVASKLSLSGTLGTATFKADTVGAIGFLIIQPTMLFFFAVGIIVLSLMF